MFITLFRSFSSRHTKNKKIKKTKHDCRHRFTYQPAGGGGKVCLAEQGDKKINEF